MEDDKKTAVAEEATENVQQETELPNEEVKVDPIDTPSEESRDQFVEQPTGDIESSEGDVPDTTNIEGATSEPSEAPVDTNSADSINAEESIHEPDVDEPESSSGIQNETAISEIAHDTTEVRQEETKSQTELAEAAGEEIESPIVDQAELTDSAQNETAISEIEPDTAEVQQEETESQTELAEAANQETEAPLVDEAEHTDSVQNETDTNEPETEDREVQEEEAEPQPKTEEVKAEESTDKQTPIEPNVAQDESTTQISEDSATDEPETAQDQLGEKEIEAIDLDTLSKIEQLDLLKKILDETDIRKIDGLFKDLGGHYQTNFDADKKAALETFLKIEGSDEADFEFKGDDTDQEFHSMYEKLRRKRAHFYQELGKEKDNNLKKKNEILVLLREIIDGENQESFDRVKSLQQEWKNIGSVPGVQNHTLWASYHALMDRFYDHRSIYFELKELDQRKNLDAKFELCKKAEMLGASTDLRFAVAHLNELHEEFKHIGPVPREDQEALWQRFKAASDQVYEKRNEFHENQKAEFAANLEKKLALLEGAKDLVAFDSDRIKHWNSKTKELLDLQKQWEAIGGIPRQSAKDVNKAFWGSFKKFFANKSRFFKKLDGERDENLTKKKALIQKALEIRNGEDWEITANEMKGLQSQWKEIGIVPDKFRKSLYKEFNEHCNYFFERKRGQNAKQNKEFEKNLEKKKAILVKLQAMTDDKGFDLDQAFVLLDEFAAAGLVPRNTVGKTLEKYDKVCAQLLKVSTLSEIELDELKSRIQVSKLRNSPNAGRKINRQEGLLKRKISGMESDIYNWKRNIDFFGRSKNAEQMKSDFLNRISDAEKEIESMKKELRLLNH